MDLNKTTAGDICRSHISPANYGIHAYRLNILLLRNTSPCWSYQALQASCDPLLVKWILTVPRIN